jgi:uncharacterized membrane protein YhhN
MILFEFIASSSLLPVWTSGEEKGQQDSCGYCDRMAATLTIRTAYRDYTQWEMRTSGLLFAVSAAASLTFLLARPLTAGDWPVIFKVLSILLLAVLGFRVDGLLGGALALSSLGDFLLGVRRLESLDGESLFLLGLVAFLIAHLVYIVLFRKYLTLVWWKSSPARMWGVLAILVALGSVLGILRQSLGSMLIPVVVYSLVLSCMGISAMLADLGTPLAGFGALLFIASDAMIAITKFRGPFPGNGQLIWITYYSAQFLILRGVERRCDSKKPEGPSALTG